MTEPITSLPAAVAAQGALPMPAGPDRLTPEREAEIQTRDLLATKGPWGLYEEATGHQHIAASLEETGHGYRCRRGIAQLDPEPIDNDLAHRDWSEAEDREQVRIDAEFVAHAREDVPALLAELAAVRAERNEAQARVADVEAEREKLIRWHGEDSKAITRLMARVTELQENLRAVNAGWGVARARVDTWEKAAEQIRHLHKDSPMGPCPVCVDGDAMARGDDPTVPYPCPTARLAGATDCDPPSFRNTAGRGETR